MHLVTYYAIRILLALKLLGTLHVVDTTDSCTDNGAPKQYRGKVGRGGKAIHRGSVRRLFFLCVNSNFPFKLHRVCGTTVQ